MTGVMFNRTVSGFMKLDRVEAVVVCKSVILSRYVCRKLNNNTCNRERGIKIRHFFGVAKWLSAQLMRLGDEKRERAWL